MALFCSPLRQFGKALAARFKIRKLVEARGGRREQHDTASGSSGKSRRHSGFQTPDIFIGAARLGQSAREGSTILADQKRLFDAGEKRRQVIDAARLAHTSGDPDKPLVAD